MIASAPIPHILVYEDGTNTSASPTKSSAKRWLMCTARGQVARKRVSLRATSACGDRNSHHHKCEQVLGFSSE